MPKSKSRSSKPRSAGQRYRLEPHRKQRSRKSPRWYGPMILGLMGAGVLIIVLNYMQVLPGTEAGARPEFLFAGLGLILVGFIGTTRWH